VWQRLFSLDYRRRRLAAKAPPGPLRDYLEMAFPRPGTDCGQAGYLALDLETTGLDPAQDEIVSFGWVAMNGPVIDLASARHCLVRTTRDIPEASAVIHQITDDAAAAGRPLREVLGGLLDALAGRALIAHHARVELGFLGAACRRVYGGQFLAPAVDTLWLARRSLERRGQVIREGELRLAALRERYNLPRYRAHDALSDALAAAELYAAQLAEARAGGALALRRVLLPQ
jgi:DNA polymerase-3 subunit epsilon